MLLLHQRAKKTAPAGAEDAPETVPEPVNDPNYTSILEEDEEDPYDRSYGFPTEDPEDTADEAAEPEAEDAAGAASGEDAE